MLISRSPLYNELCILYDYCSSLVKCESFRWFSAARMKKARKRRRQNALRQMKCASSQSVCAWSISVRSKKGKVMCNSRIFGYDKKNCKLIINEKEAVFQILLFLNLSTFLIICLIKQINRFALDFFYLRSYNNT